MDELKETINKNLLIHAKYCSKTPISQVAECFLCGKWIRARQQELKYVKPPMHNHLSPDEIQSSLQLSVNIGEFWQKVLIQVLPKKDFDVFTLQKFTNSPKSHLVNNLTYSQLLHYVSAANIKNLWKDSYQAFPDHAIIKQWKDGDQLSVEPQRKVLKNALFRLYKCPIIPLNSDVCTDNQNPSLIQHEVHPNVHKAFFIIEGPDHFFVFLEPSSFSLWDCVNFSLTKLKENECAALFVVFQLLEGMRSIQDHGLFLGNASLHNLRLGSDFHLTLIPHITDSLMQPQPPQISGANCDVKRHSRFPNGGFEFCQVPTNHMNGFWHRLTSMEAKEALHQVDHEVSANNSEDLHRNSLLHLTQKWSPAGIEARRVHNPPDISNNKVAHEIPNIALLVLGCQEIKVVHEISNFDYLLCLSYFAGHSFESPVFYPTLPWVIDFTSPNAGWRDLTKSKYRLNKGDQQLDHTYKLAESAQHHDQIAHHIPEFFSEVTYYVYKARVTPKEILQKHVRQHFVASHYPSSIARMFSLTPEECIPEFYCDPSVFKSIHPDLPDLEVPPWCDSVGDFLQRHRASLESNYVSRRLHHWIDLYYGYKLTGSASVKANNVCLPLVDDHVSLSKGGIVQLFNIPHPPKLAPSPFLSRSPPLPFSASSGRHRLSNSYKGSEASKETSSDILKEDDSVLPKETVNSKTSKALSQEEKASLNQIELPINYNPLTALNQVEMIYNFFLKTSGKLPDKMTTPCAGTSSVEKAAHLRRVRDVQVLGCLIVQIFCPARCRILSLEANLAQMCDLTRKILVEPNDIPKSLLHSLKIIFQINENQPKSLPTLPPPQFRPVTESGLPPPSPHQMLQPLIDIISFPSYIPHLASFIKLLKQQSRLLRELFFTADDPRKVREASYRLAEQHVAKTAKELPHLLPQLPSDGLKLVLPHVIEMYQNPASSVCAAWQLTYSISQALGPTESRKHLLPLLVKLFEGDSMSDRHFKLFHHAFLLQLMVRFGLKAFLKHFITPIIEGAGGYKAPVKGSASSVLQQPKILRNPDAGFGLEEPTLSSSSGEALHHVAGWESSSERDKVLRRRDSSIRSPSGAEADITDAENDTEIFVFEGGDDEDTLNDFAPTPSLDMSASPKSPVSDAMSLESLQGGGGSLPSLCPSPHSPTLSDGDMDEFVSPEECSPVARGRDSSLGIPIPHLRALGVSPKSTLYSSSLPDKPLDSRTPSTPGGRDGRARPSRPPVLQRQSSVSSGHLPDSDLSLADICCESVLWLSHRLGPVLTARHLTRNLLRMLSLCYLPETGALTPRPRTHRNPAFSLSVTGKEVLGDVNAARILHCLSEIADLYGEQVILLQYLCHITELVNWCGSKLTTNQEAGLIGAMALLQHLLLKLSDVTFMDYLQETLIRSAVYPVIRLLASVKVQFASGAPVRMILAWRVIDSLCMMVRRVGREMSKEKLTPAITRFLTAFEKVHASKWQQQGVAATTPFASRTRLEELADPVQEHKEKALEELKNVFTAEMAFLSYVPLCRFLGANHMENSLPNHDLIRSLCLQFDENNQADYAAMLTMDTRPSLESGTGTDPSTSANVAVTGNRIDINDAADSVFTASNPGSSLGNLDSPINSKCGGSKVESTVRHLRGNWLAYWEHEIGLSEQDESFNFKQIKLQNFVGHSNSVKSIYVLDNENSFMSCSKDKTVKLWSLRSRGDGNAECSPQWTYSNHKKSVFDVVFCESLRVAASCDSTVHIWDPFTGTCLKQLDSLRLSPVTVLTAISAPSTQLITATTDSTLKFIDLRTYSYTHELKITTSSEGLVRCLSTSDDSHLVAVAHSSGVIATLDLRTGQLLASWKPHEGEVLTLQWYEKGTFVSSALDQTTCVWSIYENKLKFLLKGPTEPVHLMNIFGNEVLTGTTANRIGLYSSVSPDANFSCNRLRSDTFKGVLTSMAILPLNRQLLLGADNGSIKLLC